MFDLFLGTAFWASATPMWGIAVVATLLLLFWDWRLLLPGLALIQYGVGQVLIHRYGVPAPWLVIYFWVVVLAGLILSLSPMQTRKYQPMDRSGNVVFRGALLLLLLALVYSISLDLPLPILDVATTRLFLWLAACAFLTLALTDNAFFTGAGMLLWLIPVQSLMAVILPQPALIALLGTLLLLVSLACGYLTLAESERMAERAAPPTDIVFPAEPVHPPQLQPLNVRLLRHLVASRLAAAMDVLKRNSG